MNEETSCVTNEKKKRPRMNGKMTPNFFQLYTLYIKIRTSLFPYFITNLFKRRYISSATTYKYLNMLISERLHLLENYFLS